MKKRILFFLLLSSVCISAQTTIFSENFDTVNFPSVPTDWTTLDLDGDGSSWFTEDTSSVTDAFGFSGGVCGVYEDNPDNVLGTPSITLPAGNALSLGFKIGTYTGGFLDYANHYAVYVLPASATFSTSAVPLLEETIAGADLAYTKSVSLNSFAGQAVKIYFRQFNSPFKGAIILDAVKITQGSLATLETKSKTQSVIYPNPTTDVLNIKSESIINNVTVVDMSGRNMDVKLENDQVNVKALSAGSYLINIETKDGISTEKFIKK